MIIITGGAGCIGSCLHQALQARGEQTAIVDSLGNGGKWHNLCKHVPDFLIAPGELDAFLDSRPDVTAVFHLGAINDTTAADGDRVWRTNVDLSLRLLEWCAREEARFIYASSAATYGAADRPGMFSDDPAHLATLRPTSLYGWSKHAFDCLLQRRLAQGDLQGLSWAGLKLFNVYGPNEYHKGAMASLVYAKYAEIHAGGPARLFRSDRPEVADGHQARDFIWVGDVVSVMLWLLDHQHVHGLFNCGTGVARTCLELVDAVCDAAGVARRVEFIDMPAALHGQYQSYTCADMTRLRTAGYAQPFTPLAQGVKHYVRDYLAAADPYL
ncbi:ADP-glyceromanno-heptose 6-epimerase [Gluconacetobacter entanii]|uniref:ADP-glyceromanno-heptose 6-epimerase n=1 Tax=Gluconacetobacter entanii TaxID=108528 RepID=A0A318PW15_9PROT|nr:ADP-glyceromanno-heptose 6-epimerase [Gluconacetobacter entanii]MBE7620370.1 ADP-glyceromanno-heptose 6-epimerase [Komagataeibacter sp. FXV2]MCE2578965.1 ADP-glyceromanno-heptose 6-epimerase [Komagataeibacter sp. FNDCR1]MBY4640810.1 ADP-glyceromanno-heptose 6-epimerase [Gluconacetobacter entanii]MCW4581165.1 ADP-glyceromanno-heptose 6-epimerase [Gluconacetobacter entanii]MCW4584425.1 ADP-glyceromanno-heptose 6-epimerase [Gluconacetobacter entanii]